MKTLSDTEIENVSGGNNATDTLTAGTAGGALGGLMATGTAAGAAAGSALGLAAASSFLIGYSIGNYIAENSSIDEWLAEMMYEAVEGMNQ